MAKPSKKVVLAILDKLSLEHSSKITLERAQKKLEEAIESGGIPEDVNLTAAEIKGLEQMGFEIDMDEEPEPTDADLDEIEDEEPAPAKKKKEKKKKEPKAKKEKKPTKKSRRTITCDILKKKKNHSMEALIDDANNAYAEQGGKDNHKEAAFIVHRVVDILEDFGVLERNEDKIKIS